LRFHVHLPMRKSLSAAFRRRHCPYIKAKRDTGRPADAALN